MALVARGLSMVPVLPELVSGSLGMGMGLRLWLGLGLEVGGQPAALAAVLSNSIGRAAVAPLRQSAARIHANPHVSTADVAARAASAPAPLQIPLVAVAPHGAAAAAAADADPDNAAPAAAVPTSTRQARVLNPAKPPQ